MPYAETIQQPTLAVWSGDGRDANPSTVQFLALAVIDGIPVADFVETIQFMALAVVDTQPQQSELGFPGTSQLFALGVYGVGGTEDYTTRAWTFTLDGHKFYVLHLGQLGTWVYDFASDQWSQWGTQGYDTWNAHHGLNWNGYVLAGDDSNPIVWKLDPAQTLDEGFRTIERKVTALIPASKRDFYTVDGLYITASVGFDQGVAPSIGLRFSDDYGRSWVSARDIALVLGETSQEIAWTSLGSFTAPGRVIEITDQGGPVRIDRGSVIINGE